MDIKNTNIKCLIVDEIHESIFNFLDKAGIFYTYLPDAQRKEIVSEISEYEILIIRSKTRVDSELLSNARQLKIVARAGAGVDNIDEEYLAGHNIALVNAPEGNRDSVAEQTVAMLLSLMHNVVKSHKEVTSSKLWDREGNRGVELYGKKVGIIGYGNIGKSLAKRLKSFGCRVLAYDKYLINYGDEYCQQVSLVELQKQSDVISLHVPLTHETRSWIDFSFFEKCKRGIYFLNTARGEIVSLEQLKQALESGIVKATALDVLENEKLDSLSPTQAKLFDYFAKHDNVILTPHIGGWSVESYQKINKVLTEKIVDIITNN